jgi:DNA-binding MarR family transcriptional regulator
LLVESAYERPCKLSSSAPAKIDFLLISISVLLTGRSLEPGNSLDLNKGPLPLNAIGPKVYLTPGSISTAVDRLVERGLVSRVESPEDRRVRVVSLTPKGKRLIAPVFRKHAADIRKVFADASPKELRALETTLKKIGKRAENLGTGVNPKCLSQR